jgi:S1-C subfamily serine protease
VKNSSSKLGSILLIVVSLVLGIAVASLFRGAEQQTLDRQNSAESSGQNAHATASETRFVQDPPQRTTFRPDFSSGLRRSNQRNNFFMLRAFHDAIGDSWKSTVRLTSGGQQLALGAVVSSDGWIISKASELPSSGEVTCRLYDGKDYEGKVVTQVADLDLALIRINQTQLVPSPGI